MDKPLQKHIDQIMEFRNSFHTILDSCSGLGLGSKAGEGEISLIFSPFYDKPPYARVGLCIRSYLLVNTGRTLLIEEATWDAVCAKLPDILESFRDTYKHY